MNVVLTGVLAYVAAQIVFGVYLSRRMKTEEDYLLAGRSMGPMLATFTIFATWFGAETCIGAAGRAFSGGLSETAAEPFGYALCLLFMGLVFAAALWRRKLTTLADLFRGRYGTNVERLSVLLMVPTSILWAAAQIRAFGQILAATGGLQVGWAVTLAAVVVIAYTTMGGFLADAVSDLVQGLVLAAGLVILAVLFVGSGGAADLLYLPAERLRLVGEGRSFLDGLEVFAVPIVGSVVAPELVARVLAARSPQVARGAAVAASGMYFVIGMVPVALGLAAARSGVEIAVPDQLLVEMAGRLLPLALYIVFAGALVSALLSTVDSALLVAGSLVAHNVVLPLREGLSERTKVLVNRSAVVGAGLIAYVLAFTGEGVYELVLEASGFGSAGIFVAMVFALFSRFGGPAAAAGAMVSGVTVYAVGAHVIGMDHPFVASVAAALGLYLVLGLAERLMMRSRTGP